LQSGRCARGAPLPIRRVATVVGRGNSAKKRKLPAAPCKNPPQVVAFRAGPAIMPRGGRRLAAADGGLLMSEASFTPEAGAEPIPGYHLIRLLGRGGFGEVWQASAPGGFQVALKFVRLSTGQSIVELRSLELLKTLRHPHLVATFGAW